MKITVIGGGSTYTPELVSGFIRRRASLPLGELWLMDIDAERLRVVGGFAQRMVAAAGSPFKVVLSGDRAAALEGASYVVSQLRVGKMPARREDEYLGLRHGLIGQETTGVGGMANALRTIPVVLDIAADMRRLAPGALLLNFANPSGLVAESLARHAPGLPFVGVCNIGITAKMSFLSIWEELTGEKVEPDRAELDSLGLNHLTWHRGFRIDGKDVWPQLFPAILERESARPAAGAGAAGGATQAVAGAAPAGAKGAAGGEWDRDTLETLGMVPNYYLQYYYYTSRKLAEQSSWPPSRAEAVMAIERDLLALYSDPKLVEPPPELMKRGGAWYSELATHVIDDHWNDRGRVHIVNVRNDGAVPSWPADWVLELPAAVDRRGARSLPARPLEGAPAGLVAQVKAYELLTVDAAVKGDRRAAREALLAHPLGPEADKVSAFLEDLLETNRKHLPRFFA